MSRKTKQPTDTDYIFDNYSQSIQELNEIKYEAIQMRSQIAKMDKALERIIGFRPKVSIRPRLGVSISNK